MHCSLMIVGAHSGKKMASLIQQAIDSNGNVVLVEPVSHLFNDLEKKYSGVAQVTLINAAIIDGDEPKVNFFAPVVGQNSSLISQLGSLKKGHANSHLKVTDGAFEEIKVRAINFDRLISKLKVSSIDTLITDTEGYDAIILCTFPFHKMRPRQILFEHKHADGPFNMGKNMGYLLIYLEAYRYKVKVHDIENSLATRID